MIGAITDWQWWFLFFPYESVLMWRKDGENCPQFKFLPWSIVSTCFLHIQQVLKQNTILIIWKKGHQCKWHWGVTVAHSQWRSTSWMFRITGTHGQTNGDGKPLYWRANQNHWSEETFKLGTHTLEALVVEADDLTAVPLLETIGRGSLASDEEQCGVPGGVRSLITKELIKKREHIWLKMKFMFIN